MSSVVNEQHPPLPKGKSSISPNSRTSVSEQVIFCNETHFLDCVRPLSKARVSRFSHLLLKNPVCNIFDFYISRSLMYFQQSNKLIKVCSQPKYSKCNLVFLLIELFLFLYKKIQIAGVLLLTSTATVLEDRGLPCPFTLGLVGTRGGGAMWTIQVPDSTFCI